MTLFELKQQLQRFAFRLPAAEQPLDPALRKRATRAYRMGMLIIGGLTGLLLGWLLYRYLLRPEWVGRLPALLGELFSLLETAAAFSLALIWAGLGLRHWRQQRAAALLLTPESVAEAQEALYELSPKAFERYVASLFRQKGYRTVLRGRSGDHGVDLELTADNGRRAIVQCKRYQNTVGEEIVRELYGTMLHERVAHAFLVTTADISDAAVEWARGKPMTLIDGKTLVRIAASLRRSQAP